MTEYEYYAKEIKDVVVSAFAIEKVTGRIKPCSDTLCSDCACYSDVKLESCTKFWDREHVDLTPEFKVDEVVECSDDGENWVLRHFAYREGKDNWVWINGCDSVTAENNTERFRYVRPWKGKDAIHPDVRIF